MNERIGLTWKRVQDTSLSISTLSFIFLIALARYSNHTKGRGTGRACMRTSPPLARCVRAARLAVHLGFLLHRTSNMRHRHLDTFMLWLHSIVSTIDSLYFGKIFNSFNFSKTPLNPSQTSTSSFHPASLAFSKLPSSFQVLPAAKSIKSHVAYSKTFGSRSSFRAISGNFSLFLTDHSWIE